MAPTLIRGTVRSRGDEPIVEARVYYTEAPGAFPDVAALTNEEGGFVLTAPAPGRYRIECAAAGYRTTTTAVDVDGTAPETVVTIALEARQE